MLGPRALARLIGMLWMLALALLGLGVALYCFDGLVSLDSVRPDRLLGLPGVRRYVGHFLDQLVAPGPTAGLALICGLGAMLLGLLLLLGTLRSAKQRLALLEPNKDDGILAARPRTLREMSQALAEQAAGAASVKRPKLRLARSGARGRLTVTASRARTDDRRVVERAVKDQLEPLSAPFKLKARVRVRVGDRGERVE